MTASVTVLRPAAGDPLAHARATRDEARDSALALAELIVSEASTLADRCAEASKIDTMPAGLADAIRKLGMELSSRVLSANQILGSTK